MEHIPDREMSPPEYPSLPPCPECGVEQWFAAGFVKALDYVECHNPDCPECAKAYRDDPESDR